MVADSGSNVSNIPATVGEMNFKLLMKQINDIIVPKKTINPTPNTVPKVSLGTSTQKG